MLWSGEPISAHLFAATAPASLPLEWLHHVSGKGEDSGMRFRFFWLPHSDWDKLWEGFQRGFPLLTQFINKTITAKKT
jgi:hypothetical protein